MTLRFFSLCVMLLGLAASLGAQSTTQCTDLPTVADLKIHLAAAADSTAGGLFGGSRMWAAVVNRSGQLCALTTSTTDATQVWPGSQAIAKAKAYTANAFSVDALPLSTAQLYTFSQPGHSLWSLGQSNLFNPSLVAGAAAIAADTIQLPGLIFFGGGLALYKAGKVIGALGISGDTSCADHEVAKRVRIAASLNPPGGALADDISYSWIDGASAFSHPLCVNTYRNDVFLGSERPATGY